MEPGHDQGRRVVSPVGSDPNREREVEDMSAGEERPEALQAVAEGHVVELDVRDDLRQGREPFQRIMAAKEAIPPGGALKLRAIFEPAPLYGVLGSQGFEHWTEQLGDEDWVVWFWRVAPEAVEASARPDREGAPGQSSEGGDGIVVLDVRGLEPPEPMVRTLAALDALPRGQTLVQLNVREPRFLLPKLEEQGFEYEVKRQSEDLVRVFIRHAGV